MINKVILVGRLTRDPELRYTTNGVANLRFSLAVNRNFKDDKGNQQADFINCMAWRGQAENMAKFLKKGALIGVEGRIETGSYDDNGTTRYTTNVVASSITFLESKKDNNNQQPQQHQEAGYHPFASPGPNNTPDFESPNFNPYDPNFSNPNAAANYNNPFDTATTRAGQVRNDVQINITDDDLPF